MKRILIAGAFALAAGGSALAADLPPPMAPPPRAPATYIPTVVPVYNWSGIYIGVNGGYNFGTVTPTGLPSISTNGFLAGGTLGFNYMWGPIVLGIEGDGDYNSENSGGFKSNWLATARGRAGYAFDRILLYATGGGAFASANITGPAGSGIGGSGTMTGWTAGGGIEFAFAPSWTAKAEYLYIDFPSPSIGGVTFKDTDNLIRAGVNYKFTF